MSSVIEPQFGLNAAGAANPGLRIRFRPAALPRVATVLIGPSGLYQDGLISILEENGYLAVDALGSVEEFDPDSQPELILLTEFAWSEEMREAIPQLRRMAPKARIAILAEPSDGTMLRSLLDLGVQACLGYLTQPETLIKSLNVIMSGNIVMPMEVVPYLGRTVPRAPAPRLLAPPAVAAPAPGTSETLTGREVEILSCLAGGLSNKLIARRLAIAEATVKIHVKSILRKTGLQNRTQAAIWTHQHGITPAVPCAARE
jgi:two-component system nitrate/nitrite response regulator NarL